MQARRVRARHVTLCGALALAMIGPGTAAAYGTTAVPTNWRQYLEQPSSSYVAPVKVTVLHGKVTNAKGLAGHGQTTTLTTGAHGAPATVLLDFGREVLGTPYIRVRAYSEHDATLPTVSLAFSESKQYMRTPGSSTLADAASAGDRSLTVAPPPRFSPQGFAVGDTVTIGGTSGETDRITAVSGSTLRLKTPLSHAYPVGATVTSVPGAITGDSAFMPRSETVTVNARSMLKGTFQGGFRYEAITLTTPGKLVLSGAGVDYRDGGVLENASSYQGYFLSSSNSFNTMYYDGAYTVQTDLQPAGLFNNTGTPGPAVLDGSKRDRAIWSGDLGIEGQNIADTLGSNGNNYVKQSLLTLINASPQNGGLNADTLFRNGPYSNSYSHWTLDAATEYYRNTGDTSFAQQVLPWLEGQLTYDATQTDSDGLIVTQPPISAPNGGYDWDFYDGPKTGVVTAFNVLYYRALRDVAYVEQHLGNADKATAYDQTADQVESAINAHLLNRATGTYYLSESDHDTFAQDANSLAVLFGVAPSYDVPKITEALKALWGAHGSEPFSAGSPYSDLISPFVTAFEVEADYRAGDTTAAENLLHLTWDQMINRHNPFYTGTFWENIGPDGTATESRTSLAHGWASGPTPIMISDVLGVNAVDPGYQTFTVSPHFGSLRWAKGAVPTPYGQIRVSWKKVGGHISLSVYAPPGTAASIDLGGSSAKTVVHGGSAGATRTVTH